MSNSKKEFIKGPALEKEIPNCSYAEFVYPRFKSRPKGHIIQVDSSSGYEETSQDLLTKSLNIEEGFRKLGLTQEDVISFIAKNSSHVFAASLAVFWMGGVVAPFDSEWNVFEFQVVFEKTNPKAILCDEEIVEKIETALEKAGKNAIVIVFAEKQKVKSPRIDFQELLKNKVDVDTYVPKSVKSPSDKLLLIYPTSGSTGTSKGVGITHRNVIFQTLSLMQNDYTRLPQNILVISPFFWITCLISFVISLYNGTKRVYMPEINSRNILRAIHEYKPDNVIIGPAALSQIIEQPDFHSFDVSSLKSMFIGGSVVPESSGKHVQKSFKGNPQIFNLYGMTEMTGIVLASEPGKSFLFSKPNNEIEIKIVDPETGKVLGPNERGELWVRSPGLMKCYVGDEEETKAAISNGWFLTGDLGYYDEMENFYLIGRLKDMLKDLGRQVAPSEIEGVIESLPGVIEAGVVGFEKDYRLNLIGFIVKKQDSDIDENAIKKAIKENLANYKQLKMIKFVDNLPRTNTGKLRRKDLLEKALSLTI